MVKSLCTVSEPLDEGMVFFGVEALAVSLTAAWTPVYAPAGSVTDADEQVLDVPARAGKTSVAAVHDQRKAVPTQSAVALDAIDKRCARRGPTCTASAAQAIGPCVHGIGKGTGRRRREA